MAQDCGAILRPGGAWDIDEQRIRADVLLHVAGADDRIRQQQLAQTLALLSGYNFARRQRVVAQDLCRGIQLNTYGGLRNPTFLMLPCVAVKALIELASSGSALSSLVISTQGLNWQHPAFCSCNS